MSITDGRTVDDEDARIVFDNVQPAIERDPGDPIDDLLRTVVDLLDDIDQTTEQLYDDRFIGTASDRELERLGGPVNIQRKTGESDEKLRKRIRAAYAARRSSGTYEEIAQVALLALDTDASKIRLDRAENTQDPATTLLTSTDAVFNDSPFTQAEVADLLGEATIGGHRVEVQREDVFTWDDGTLGWGTEWGASTSG